MWHKYPTTAPVWHNYFDPSTIVDALLACDFTDWVHTVPQNCSITSSIHSQDTWGSKYVDCKGKSQSPLHLRFLQSTYKQMESISFFNYDDDISLDVTIMGDNLAVYGGPLHVEYTFVQGVLHFGTGSGQGAEHHIDEQSNVAELQLIHYTETNIPIKCFKDANGLLVLVILFKEAEKNNSALSAFMTAVSELHGLSDTSPRTTLKFPMSNFMPSTTENYYIYSGSLTFPPCTERVINVVLGRSVDIGKEQLMELRKLKWQLKTPQSCRDGPVAGNIRKLIQPATGAESRTVYRNFRFMTRQGAPRSAPPPATLVALISAQMLVSAAVF
ncbi:carbonic anhydrase 1-like [Haemaphysalis longicornis]